MPIRLLLILAPFVFADPAPQATVPKDPDGRGVEAEHFIFFAVLEGLFGDGNCNDVVRKILERDEKVPGGLANFVYSCPICMPCVEAFRAHLARDKYEYSRKGDMLGPSTMPNELAKPILEGTPEARRAAIQKLVERYIQRRMALMRLTDEERAAWGKILENRREVGMRTLKSIQLPWKECPSCEGAFQGSKKK